jgi:hypothetical protein
MHTEMLVKEIFNFQDGRTVFVGDISGDDKFIRECDCEIFIDDILFSTVHIEGEMLPCNTNSKLRSISTTSKIDTSKLPYKYKSVKIRCSI